MTDGPNTKPLGVVLLDKPTGKSSFAALGAVKRSLGTRKVGHTGTLDPFASGLLIALVGKATRTARVFDGLSKQYEAEFMFGTQTDTDDCTGKPVAQASLPDESKLHEAVAEFTGVIEQVPPAYSAIHIDGRRAYEYARSGNAVEIPVRTVAVHDLTVLSTSVRAGRIELLRAAITCSTGTYIRSIGRDMAVSMGSVAHVSALRRTQIGPYTVENASNPDALSTTTPTTLPEMLGQLPDVLVVDVDIRMATAVSHGRRIPTSQLPRGWNEHPWILLTNEGRAVALAHHEDGSLKYDAVLIDHD